MLCVACVYKYEGLRANVCMCASLHFKEKSCVSTRKVTLIVKNICNQRYVMVVFQPKCVNEHPYMDAYVCVYVFIYYFI